MIREEGHIGLLGGVLLVYAVLTAKLFVQYPTYLIRAGGPAGWQSTMVMALATLLLFLPVGALAVRFPGRGLHQIAAEVAGGFFGPLLTLLVTAYCFISLTVAVRNFAETFIATILPDTPPSVLIVASVAIAGYTSWRGLESLTRATQVLLPVILAGILVVLLGNVPRFDTSYLYPIWGYGPTATVYGGLYYVGMAGETIVLLALAYAFRKGQDVKRAGLIGLALFGVVAVCTILVLTVVFGAPDAGQQPFAMFNLSQLIYLGRFFQRTEALLVMFWFFNVIVRVSALLHTTTITLTGVLALPYHRPLIVPVAVLAASLSFLPDDTVTLSRMQQEWLTPMGTCILLLPMLLLILAMIRGKGGQTHAA